MTHTHTHTHTRGTAEGTRPTALPTSLPTAHPTGAHPKIWMAKEKRDGDGDGDGDAPDPNMVQPYGGPPTDRDGRKAYGVNKKHRHYGRRAAAVADDDDSSFGDGDGDGEDDDDSSSTSEGVARLARRRAVNAKTYHWWDNQTGGPLMDLVTGNPNVRNMNYKESAPQGKEF